jgi:hypothetical protein
LGAVCLGLGLGLVVGWRRCHDSKPPREQELRALLWSG